MVDGLLLGLILVCHYILSMSQSIPSVIKATNFEDVVCIPFSSKLDVSYIVESAFSVAFQ